MRYSSSNHAPGTSPEVEKLLTIAAAADALGLYYWQVQRAVKAKLIPSYTPFGSRHLLRLSEVVAFIDAQRQGGGQ